MPVQRLIDEEQMQGVVDALFAISHGLKAVASALNYSGGIAEEGARMGAIEVLSMEIADGFKDLSAAIREHGNQGVPASKSAKRQKDGD
jgi:hypothetical protein